MNWRLAEFVESLFADVVFLGYNYVASLLTLLRRPVRGAIRLYIRFRRAGIRQVAPHTVLFLTILLLALAWRQFAAANFAVERENQTSLPSLVRSLVTEDTTPAELRHIFVASIVTLILIDAVMRLAARVAPRGRRRDRLIAVLLYSSAAQYVYLWGGAMLVFHLLSLGMTGFPFGGREKWYDVPAAIAALLGMAVGPLVVSLPIARLMVGTIRRRNPLRRSLLMLGISLAGTGIFAATLFAATDVQQWMSPPPRQVEYLRCMRENETLSAVVVIRNREKESFVLEPLGGEIETCEGADRCLEHKATVVASSRGNALPVYIVPAEGTEWIRMEAMVPPRGPIGDRCRVWTMGDRRGGLERLPAAHGRDAEAFIAGAFTYDTTP